MCSQRPNDVYSRFQLHRCVWAEAFPLGGSYVKGKIKMAYVTLYLLELIVLFDTHMAEKGWAKDKSHFLTFQVLPGRAAGMNVLSNMWENGPCPDKNNKNMKKMMRLHGIFALRYVASTPICIIEDNKDTFTSNLTRAHIQDALTHPGHGRVQRSARRGCLCGIWGVLAACHSEPGQVVLPSDQPCSHTHQNISYKTRQGKYHKHDAFFSNYFAKTIDWISTKLEGRYTGSKGRILAWRCQNVSLRPLHWAVIMGRVSTEPGNKMPLRSIG